MADDAIKGLDGFRQGSLALPSGEVHRLPCYEGTVSTEHGWLDAMVDSTDPEVVRRVLPRLKEVGRRSREFAARAADAVVREYAEGEPGAEALAEGREDLSLHSLEAYADGTVVLHLEDRCGRHGSDGQWPTVHFDADDEVSLVAEDG